LSPQCGDNCFARNCLADSHPPRPCSTWKRRIRPTPPADLSMQGGANTARALYPQMTSVTTGDTSGTLRPGSSSASCFGSCTTGGLGLPPPAKVRAVGGRSIHDAVRHELEMPSVGHIDLYIRVMDAHACRMSTLNLASQSSRRRKAEVLEDVSLGDLTGPIASAYAFHSSAPPTKCVV
jgi:hypothetical protein